MTIKAEHIKERRQPRHAAYKAFLQALTDLRARILVDEGYEDPSLSEQERLRSDIDSRWVDLALLGPEQVNVIAWIAYEGAIDVLSQMRIAQQRVDILLRTGHKEDNAQEAKAEAYGSELDALRALTEDLALAVNAFAKVASATLDRDGTERQRRFQWKPRRLSLIHNTAAQD